MNENAKFWLMALRSGEFSQTTGAMHKVKEVGRPDGDYFCCLGIACMVAQANGVDVKSYRDHDVVRYDGERGYLPKSVMKWLGIKYPNGSVKAQPLYGGNDDTGIYSLALLNDEGFSFLEIADIIEANEERLFHHE